VAGISYTQLSTVINGAGDPSPAAPLPGAATNISGLFAIVGATHALLEWSVAAPERSTAQLSSTTATQPSLTPDRAGGWTIQCQGFSTGRAALEATYLLPLDAADKAATTFANPLEIRAAAPNAVQWPFSLAAKLFPDSTNDNAPTWMYADGSYISLLDGGTDMKPMADSDVTVATGHVRMYFSSDQGAVVIKDDAGNVSPLLVVV
jgi:hypothetical protein